MDHQAKDTSANKQPPRPVSESQENKAEPQSTKMTATAPAMTEKQHQSTQDDEGNGKKGKGSHGSAANPSTKKSPMLPLQSKKSTQHDPSSQEGEQDGGHFSDVDLHSEDEREFDMMEDREIKEESEIIERPKNQK